MKNTRFHIQGAREIESLAVLQTLTELVWLRCGNVADIPERLSGSHFNRPTRNRTFFTYKCVYPKFLEKHPCVFCFL